MRRLSLPEVALVSFRFDVADGATKNINFYIEIIQNTKAIGIDPFDFANQQFIRNYFDFYGSLLLNQPLENAGTWNSGIERHKGLWKELKRTNRLRQDRKHWGL
jgi:hypothetical protein